MARHSISTEFERMNYRELSEWGGQFARHLERRRAVPEDDAPGAKLAGVVDGGAILSEYFAQLHVRRGQTRPRDRDDAGRIGDENASAARRRLTRRDARERFDQRVRVFPGIDRLAQLAPDRGRIKFEIAGSVDEQLLVHRGGQRENEFDQTGHEEQAGDDGERL